MAPHSGVNEQVLVCMKSPFNTNKHSLGSGVEGGESAKKFYPVLNATHRRASNDLQDNIILLYLFLVGKKRAPIKCRASDVTTGWYGFRYDFGLNFKYIIT